MLGVGSCCHLGIDKAVFLAKDFSYRARFVRSFRI